MTTPNTGAPPPPTAAKLLSLPPEFDPHMRMGDDNDAGVFRGEFTYWTRQADGAVYAGDGRWVKPTETPPKQ